jgi:hypothetical protein
MRPIIFVLLFFTTNIYAWDWPRKTIYINKTNSSITIDGIINESVWENTEKVAIAVTESEYCPGKYGGYFKMTYDDSNIFIAVSVYDDTPFLTIKDEFSQCDRIWLYFSMDTTFNVVTDSISTRALFYPGYWRISKIATPDSAIGFDGKPALYANGGILLGFPMSWWNTSIFTNPNFKISQTQTDTSYIQEWKIPLDSLDPLKKFNRTCFKFDIAIANKSDIADTNEYVCKKYWNSFEDNFWSNRTFGFVYLKKDSTVIIKLSKPSEAMSFKNNSIVFSKPTYASIFDITGKLVFKANHVLSINTTALKSGVYLVNANNETRKYIK